MPTHTEVIERDGDRWVGSIEEVPGANTQDRTLEEVRENLRDALAMVLEANRMLAEREEDA